QAGVGAHEHVLEHVLGVLTVREHLARIREQALAIAIVNGPEGLVVPGSEQGHQLFVGAQPEQPRTEPVSARGQSYRCLDCRCFHSNPRVWVFNVQHNARLRRFVLLLATCASILWSERWTLRRVSASPWRSARG